MNRCGTVANTNFLDEDILITVSHLDGNDVAQ